MARTKPQKSTRLSAESRSAEIKAAARAELEEKGYQNFQPAEVARRCGVSEATIYHYFATKRDLVSRVAEDWFAEVMARESAAIGTDIYSRLRHVVFDTFSIVRKDPALTRFILLELRPDPDYPSSKIYQLNRQFTSRVAQVVADGIESGVFRGDITPALVRNMIFGCMEHQTWAFLRGEGDFSPEQSADGIASVIFRGMSTAAAAGEEFGAKVARIEGAADALREEVRELRASLAGVKRL